MSDQEISEKEAHYISGWLALLLWLLALAGVIWLFLGSILHHGEPPVLAVLGILLLGFLAKGFVILQPNIAGVLIFFGRYSGTIREGGFFWYNPFSKRQNISLRVVSQHPDAQGQRHGRQPDRGCRRHRLARERHRQGQLRGG